MWTGTGTKLYIWTNRIQDPHQFFITPPACIFILWILISESLNQLRSPK